MTNPMTQDGAIKREMNAKELAQYSLDASDARIAKESLQAKESHRVGAIAKLVALGLTADEIAAL